MESLRGENPSKLPRPAGLEVKEPQATQVDKRRRRQRSLPKHFQYEKLDSQVDTIRLVKVEHSGLGNRLKCSLKHFSSSELARRPEGSRYTAVSYEWYLQHERAAGAYRFKKILLNECTFLVNRNLYQFLKTWRSTFSRDEEWNEWLWIDAICLNQKDDSEKGHQIPRMRMTFGHADRVLAWLGYGSAVVEDALRAIESHSETHEAMNEEGELDVSYEMVLDLPYWKRLWIVQELVVSNRASLLYRSTQVGFGAFGEGLVRYFMRDKEADEAWHDFIQRMMRIRPFRGSDNWGAVSHEMWLPSNFDFERWDTGTGKMVREICMIWWCWLAYGTDIHFMSFTELLQIFGSHECERWQDRIYALLGLAPGGENFAVDYTESRESLRRRVIESFGVSGVPFEQRTGYAACINEMLETMLDWMICSEPSDSEADFDSYSE